MTAGKIPKKYRQTLYLALMSFFMWNGCNVSNPNANITEKEIEGPFINITPDNGLEVVHYTDVLSEPKIQRSKIENAQLASQKIRVDLSSNGSFETSINTDPITPEYLYDDVDNIMVISDIEGEFDYLRHMLIKAKVMDESYNWIFGDGHLVSLGDMFDRGPQVNEILWLLYHLENQAPAHGGQVHVILGNHEAMALGGDDRYIHKRYRGLTEKLNMQYLSWYGPNTLLGKWLRSKNSIEIIGKTLFVHGGISPKLANGNLSLSGINQIVRVGISKGDMKQSLTSSERLVMGTDGPLWYRAYVDRKIKSSELQDILDLYKVDQIVIGHTVVDQIQTLFDKKVYAIDIERKNVKDYQSLLYEKNNFYKLNSQGEKLDL